MNNTSHNAGSKSLTIVRACFSFQLCYFVHSLHALLGESRVFIQSLRFMNELELSIFETKSFWSSETPWIAVADGYTGSCSTLFLFPLLMGLNAEFRLSATRFLSCAASVSSTNWPACMAVTGVTGLEGVTCLGDLIFYKTVYGVPKNLVDPLFCALNNIVG